MAKEDRYRPADINACDSAGGVPRIVSVQRIRDRAPHNAFTHLLRFNGKWWCTFREAAGHDAPTSTVRVIVSNDGKRRDSAAALAEAGVDHAGRPDDRADPSGVDR